MFHVKQNIMIQIEIDWSDYTDNFEPDEYIKVHYGINPNSVASFKVQEAIDRDEWFEECDEGKSKGECVINITFTSGRGMKLFCSNDAADKIVSMLYGDRCGFFVKVNGIKEYAICTETKVTSMPD